MEFEINFLPYKKTYLWWETIKKAWLIILLSVAGVGLVLFIGFYAKNIAQKTSTVVTSSQEYLKITREKEKVAGLVQLLNQIQGERVNWTEKLQSLSKATPDQIFINSMELQGEKSGTGGSREKRSEKLVIKGVVIISGGGDPSSSIQNFMKDLKNNPSFMAGFEEPVLVSVTNSSSEGQGESLDFEFHLFRKLEGS